MNIVHANLMVFVIFDHNLNFYPLHFYLQLCSKFWAHVEFCTTLLTKVCTTVVMDERKVRIALKLLATSHMSIRGWEELTSDLDTPIAENVTLGGALLYLFEGIVPLVTAFCLEFDKLSSSGPACKIFGRLVARDDVINPLWGFAQSVKVGEHVQQILCCTMIYKTLHTSVIYPVISSIISSASCTKEVCIYDL